MDSQILASIEKIPHFADIIHEPGLLPENTRKITDEFFERTALENSGVIDSLFRYRAPSNQHDAKAYLLIKLGKGVTGQPDIVHGGFLATVMDEVTGRLVSATGIDDGNGMFTVSIKVDYLKPVRAPGIIMAVANVSKREGRKTFLEAFIKDVSGDVCTAAEVLFLSKRAHKS